MSPRTRLGSRIDANQPEIVEALRKAGCSVLSIAMVGDGAPDLIVATHSRTLMLEIKDGDKVPSARKLTRDEKIWQKNWKGECWTVHSVEEALLATFQPDKAQALSDQGEFSGYRNQ